MVISEKRSYFDPHTGRAFQSIVPSFFNLLAHLTAEQPTPVSVRAANQTDALMQIAVRAAADQEQEVMRAHRGQVLVLRTMGKEMEMVRRALESFAKGNHPKVRVRARPHTHTHTHTRTHTHTHTHTHTRTDTRPRAQTCTACPATPCPASRCPCAPSLPSRPPFARLAPRFPDDDELCSPRIPCSLRIPTRTPHRQQPPQWLPTVFALSPTFASCRVLPASHVNGWDSRRDPRPPSSPLMRRACNHRRPYRLPTSGGDGVWGEGGGMGLQYKPDGACPSFRCCDSLHWRCAPARTAPCAASALPLPILPSLPRSRRRLWASSTFAAAAAAGSHRWRLRRRPSRAAGRSHASPPRRRSASASAPAGWSGS